MRFRLGRLLLVGLMLAACAPKAPAIIITWSTASEFNIAGFIVERSEDGGTAFQSVSPFIPASEDLMIEHDYRFADAGVESGRAYLYRLLIVHNDNTRSELGHLSARAP